MEQLDCFNRNIILVFIIRFDAFLIDFINANSLLNNEKCVFYESVALKLTAKIETLCKQILNEKFSIQMFAYTYKICI